MGKLLRMDNVGIMVSDLKAVIAFFTEIGLELEGETTVEGQWVDRIIALENAKCDIAIMRTPNGHIRLELSQFQRPKAISPKPNAPVNTLGLHRLMFAVEDINDTVARLRKHGAELIGEVVQYEEIYLLCYLRGPDSIIVALAQEL
jgi:catechol 2,3-dioxygenase-like lactoylglutathione lyase family enzyme